MGSFSAKLCVEGYTFPVIHCSYGVSQATDARGRAIQKVRYAPIELLLDVPNNDLLSTWAADPVKRLAVDILFQDAASGQTSETLHLTAAYCVGYRESFVTGDETIGAYSCMVTLVDPDGWTLTPGGPSNLQQAYQNDPFGLRQPPSTPVEVPVPIPPEVAVVVEESAWVRLAASLLRVLEVGASFPAMLAAMLLLPQTANSPGLPHVPPLLDKDALRLAELEHRYHAGEALSHGEQAEYLSLLARVRGIHLTTLHDSLADQLKAAQLRAVMPDYQNVHLAGVRGEAVGEFDGIHLGQKLFIEDKSARGLYTLNPKTGLPGQTPQQWADKQIYNATATRIAALKIASYTYPVGSPNIEQIRNFRRLHFRMEADTPDVRIAVDNSLKRLKSDYPDWDFTAQYGN